jgi:hypothetical protein
MNSIAHALSDSIKEAKWLSVTYDSTKEQRETSFWCAIRDIDPQNKTLIVDMFNATKGSNALVEKMIHFEKIKSAQVVTFSTFDYQEALVKKIEGDPLGFEWLHYENFNNNILMYLNECNQLDSDPFQKNYAMIEGIDLASFSKQKRIALSDEQVQAIVKNIYYNDLRRFDSQSNEMALSVLSIDEGGKKFVVAYYTVCFNPSEKSLRVVGELHFNSTFLIDGKPHSLTKYIDITPEEFMAGFKKDPSAMEAMLKDNFHGAEQIDTRPDFMILERDMPVNLSNLFELIGSKKEAGELSVPLKAFFGDISLRNRGYKEPAIVIYDEKINIDQMRVLYNAMKNPVTYVQGPPGTGKTQTLFNVLVSSYFNGKTALVCSMNNKPVDGIIEKLVFKNRDEPIPFPFLRLGNNKEVALATLKIRESIDTHYRGTPDVDKIEDIKKQEAAKNGQLVEYLKEYEARKAIEDNIACAERVNRESGGTPRLEEEIAALKAKLATLREVKNEEVIHLFSCASKNPRYLTYLYFSSIYHLSRLLLPRYAELREIVAIEDEEERVSRFNSWTRVDENMKLLTDVYPLIFTTNISASKLGTGLFMFDLTVMDEAGQCDEAKSLIPIARGNSLLLVGDKDQLQPVIVLDPSTNERLKEKYGIGSAYDYATNSIITTMQRADNISKRIMLSYHYRCGKKIIGFSNQYFYSESLKLDFANGEGEVALNDVRNLQHLGRRNECPDEAMALVQYIKRNEVKDAVIITPFINQQALINQLLSAEHIDSVKACTIHSIQGGEAETVILSPAISLRTSEKTFAWLKDHREIANVAVTRAQKNLIVFADSAAIEKLSKGEDNVWGELVHYAMEKGNVKVVPPQPTIAQIGKSNGSINEDEFYKTMAQLCSASTEYHCVRNVKVGKVFPEDPILQDSGLEFDLVVYKKKGFLRPERPFVAFEVNGGEHEGDPKREYYDHQKQALCHMKKLTLAVIDNGEVKDYECMREILCKMNHEKYYQSLLDFDSGDDKAPSDSKPSV